MPAASRSPAGAAPACSPASIPAPTAASPSTTPSSSTSDRHEVVQLREPALTDSGHAIEVVDAAERAVALAFLHDRRRERGPDAGQRLELLGGGGVDVDQPVGATGCRVGAGPGIGGR